jgi:hypothetical protein
MRAIKLLKPLLLSIFLLLLFTSTVSAATYYVAPNGSDSNSGSINSPFKTIQKAHDSVGAGDTIYLRSGTYNISSSQTLSRDGTSSQMIKLYAYEGEKPIIDGTNLNYGDDCLKLSGANYWHIRGLEVRWCPDYGVYLSSASNNLLELVVVHHSGHRGADGSGFQIISGSKNNTILNSDSYLNDNYGGNLTHANADGFAIKHDSGATGNKFIGCRAWRNADDGWDFWNGPPVTIENSWAWENGYGENMNHLGDGNGYKLGKGNGGHLVTNSLAWKNYARGFDFNNGAASTIYNNTGWNNGSANFAFKNYPHVLKNNLSYEGSVSLDGNVKDTYNSWNNPPGVSVTSSDFVSLDDSVARGPRKADGSLPDSGFLKLTAGSELINAGTNVGLPYTGSAPDLGAYEYGGAVNPTPSPTTQPSIPGDADGDRDVDADDYVIWINNYNQQKQGSQFGDFNNSGKVDGVDYITWLNNYGT